MARNMMLVCALLVAVLLVQPGPVDAQMQLRLNAGKTSATLEGQTRSLFAPIGQSADHGTETGLFAGASLGVPLGGRLSISPRVYFVQKGSSFASMFPTVETTLTTATGSRLTSGSSSAPTLHTARSS